MTIKINNLGYDTGIKILQDKKMFNYSVDTILLGNFISITSSTKKVLDIGTNNAALAIFVAQRKDDLKIDAIEIQKEACEIADKNIILNKLENKIRVINQDFNDYAEENKSLLTSEKYDTIICNPPFYKLSAHRTRTSQEDNVAIATHDVNLSFEQILIGVKRIIRPNGKIALVMPTERLIDMVCLMRKYNFEPKRIQFVHARTTSKSNLVLVEGRYNSGWGTHFLPNLYLHPENKKEHRYTDKIKKLYRPIKYCSRSLRKK